jgi:hypothetical protein
MTSDSRARLIGLLGAAAAATLALAALLPSKWVLRTGLGWQDDHFFAYFVTTTILCIASRRPYVVTAFFIVLSALLEALQGLTPDRIPDFTTVFWGTAGVVSAATLVTQLIRARRSWLARRRSRSSGAIVGGPHPGAGRQACVSSALVGGMSGRIFQ